MQKTKRNSNLIHQRFTVLLALLFCMFISSIEHVPVADQSASIEQQDNANSEDQTFLDVAVDAVVPFAVHVSQHALYLIYEIVHFKGTVFISEPTSIFQPNQLVEILFERIISTKGP